MLAIQRDNPSLKGILPGSTELAEVKEYTHARVDTQRLGQLTEQTTR